MAITRKAAERAWGHSEMEALHDLPAWDWDDFRIFAAVVRHGSYTRAARALGWTQSAVSRRIARLEQALGIRLFDRSCRGAELTLEGRRLSNYASGAELMLSRGVNSVLDAVRRIDSDCKIIMGDGLASYWMPAFLPAFLERNPAIGLKLYTDQNVDAARSPLFDIELHYAHPLSDESVALQVATLHFMLFGSPEYLMRFGVPQTPQDLRHHRIADTAFRLGDRGSFASWAGLDRSAILETNSSVVVGEAIRSGNVIGMLPTYAALIDTGLVPLIPEMHFHAPIYLCFDRQAGKKPAVRATIDFLKEFVFDRSRMPWFADEFACPDKGWRRILDRCLAQARDTAPSQQYAAAS